MNKQFDEKREKGAAQINIPSNLIFAGMKAFQISLCHRFTRFLL